MLGDMAELGDTAVASGRTIDGAYSGDNVEPGLVDAWGGEEEGGGWGEF